MLTPKLKENFEGRVRNLALTPHKPANALVPLFEAISNSIHAIEARFKDDASDKGKIDVIVRKEGHGGRFSMAVVDNGIGWMRRV
jgi:hypothetical protein